MIHHRSFHGALRRAALLAGTAALLSVPVASAHPAAAAAVHSGRAIAFQVDGVVHPVAGPIVIADTGALAAAGGVQHQFARQVSIAGGALTINTAGALVMGAGRQTTAASLLTNYQAHFITEDGRDVFIHADSVAAAASVSVDAAGRARARTRVDIRGLTVNGQAIAVTGAPNQVVDLPQDEVKLVLNEQDSAEGGGRADVAVAAIHFYICNCMEGHFGLVNAGITASGGGGSSGGGWSGGGGCAGAGRHH